MPGVLRRALHHRLLHCADWPSSCSSTEMWNVRTLSRALLWCLCCSLQGRELLASVLSAGSRGLGQNNAATPAIPALPNFRVAPRGHNLNTSHAHTRRLQYEPFVYIHIIIDIYVCICMRVYVSSELYTFFAATQATPITQPAQRWFRKRFAV